MKKTITELIKEIKEINKIKSRQLRNHVGRNIKFRREQLGLTQTDISKFIGMSRTSVTNIEYGNQNITLERLSQIAEILQTTPMKLVDPSPLFNDLDKKVIK